MMRHRWLPAHLAPGLSCAVALIVALSACKRRGAAGGDIDAEVAAADGPPAHAAEPQVSYLDPLTAAPWLGHADDGALVTIEFFADGTSSTTLCRLNLETFAGSLPTQKSPFTASGDLAQISWGNGEGTGSYSASSMTVAVTFTSAFGKHHAILRQRAAGAAPALAGFRKAILDDERSQAVNRDFLAKLEKGARWWKSGVGWDEVVTPDGLVSDGQTLALIRPAAKIPMKVVGLAAGGEIVVPLVCHLPPGTAIPTGDSTVGVVCELHSQGDVQSTWSLSVLNPGALTQEINARWVGRGDEPAPAGAATLYIYLAKAGTADGGAVAEINRPVSNLLKLEIEITGAPAPAKEPVSPPGGNAQAE